MLYVSHPRYFSSSLLERATYLHINITRKQNYIYNMSILSLILGEV